MICAKIAINVLKLRRVTSQEPQTSYNADEYAPETEVIAVPEPAPVFVDSTGRRSRLLRRLALAFGVLLVAYGGLVSVSLAGGPVSSSAVFPLPGLDDADDDEPEAEPVPTPKPTPTTSAARRIVESVPRDGTDQRRPAVSPSPKASAKPSKSPTPKPSPSKASASPTVTKPVESATVSQEPEPGPGSGSPVAPVPPPVVEVPGSGGAGGGGPVTESTTAPAVEPSATAGDTSPPSPPAAVDDPADKATPSTRAAP